MTDGRASGPGPGPGPDRFRFFARFVPVLIAAGCANSDQSGDANGNTKRESEKVAVTRWREVKQEIRDRFTRVQHVTTAQVRTLLASATPPLVIDVRTPAEFAVSHLRGARNLPLDAAPVELPGDRPILVYCSVGYRSAQAAERLRAAGHRVVSNYLGSIFEWANEGLPLFRGTNRVTKVHPYDDDWGRLLRPRLRR